MKFRIMPQEIGGAQDWLVAQFHSFHGIARALRDMFPTRDANELVFVECLEPDAEDVRYYRLGDGEYMA